MKRYIKKPKLREEIEILHSLLIDLHTARWTGNSELVAFLLDKIGGYSYSFTNSNGYYDEEEQNQRYHLLQLKSENWIEQWKVKKGEIELKKKEERIKRLRENIETARAVLKFSNNEEEKLIAMNTIEKFNKIGIEIGELTVDEVELVASKRLIEERKNE